MRQAGYTTQGEPVSLTPTVNMLSFRVDILWKYIMSLRPLRGLANNIFHKISTQNDN